MYGWIKTDKIIETSSSDKGVLSYHANWVNQKNEMLLEETTKFEICGAPHWRMIDRSPILKANTNILFADAKDGMLVGVAHEFQTPSVTDQRFTDDKGNVSIAKKGRDSVADGNHLMSEGKEVMMRGAPERLV